MTKDEVARMTEDVKKIRIEIADNGYEVQNAKDLAIKLEKKIEANQKDLKTQLNPIREKGN